MRTWDSEVASVPGAPGVMAVTSRVSVPTWICFHDAGLTRRDRGFAPPGPHVAVQSAPVNALPPGAQEMLESVQGLEVRGGSRVSLASWMPTCSVPTCVPASLGRGNRVGTMGNLLPGPLPSGPNARAAIQGTPAKFPGPCPASLLPRGKPLHFLTSFETDQIEESWLTSKRGLFSLLTFFGRGNKLFSFFSMGCW